ncbi:MAG TPA: hypothetical protein VFJ57_12085 [Solirubrobacterales bacterium]|nr:hypothetical protein [Solirubrobacterales bacterium]
MGGRTPKGARQPKVIRSYRLVFRRRWRIFRIQNWRIPLPGGLELRAVGYWLACMAALALAARLPGLGLLLASLPASIRFAVLPLAGAWALCNLEIDGRSPHRALAALVLWRLRPRSLAAFRRCPGPGELGFAEPRIALAADLSSPTYPRGRLCGPARVLLRYPVAVRAEGARGRGRSREERIAAARRWRLRATGAGPLRRGRVLEVPAGREVIFE